MFPSKLHEPLGVGVGVGIVPALSILGRAPTARAERRALPDAPPAAPAAPATRPALPARRATGRGAFLLALLALPLVLSPRLTTALAEPPGRSFVATDYTGGRVVVVSREGTVEWEYPAPNCNDLWALPNGNLLFNTGHGVREVTRAKSVVFDYQSPSEIYACQRLTNGLTFIAECNAGRLLEVEPTGRIAKEIRLLPPGRDGGHSYIRNARRLPDGGYLVTHYGEQVVREYDSQGGVRRTIPAPGGPHSAVRLPEGHTLITCGDMTGAGQVFEVDAAGQTVWQVRGDELPGVSLKFVAGLQRLPNGNTVLCNWLGHGNLGKAPHLVEVTRDKQVAWTYADHALFKTISSIQMLEAGPAAPH